MIYCRRRVRSSVRYQPGQLQARGTHEAHEAADKKERLGAEHVNDDVLGAAIPGPVSCVVSPIDTAQRSAT
jgi:hypothetical protein